MDNLAYYYTLKDAARHRTSDVINKRLIKTGGIQQWTGLTLCSIFGMDVGNALEFASNEWPKYYDEAGHHGFAESWEKLAYRYCHGADFFDLAIWQKVEGKQVLVALALGNPSHGRTHLTLKWIERFFGDNHLGGRALWPILTCAEEYAKLLGSERVLIKEPVDPAKYERYGYERYHHAQVPHGGNYLGKEL